MKLFLILIIIVSSLQVFAQRLTVEKESYPFSEIYEWKGRGSILINKDPLGLLRETNLTLVDNKGETLWQESFSPKVNKPFLVLSEESKYLYYIDYLTFDNGKVYYHQVNESGSVKSSSFSLLTHIKKLGFNDPADLELVDIVNTAKSMIFQFQIKNKKEKHYDQILIFMTHNNRLVYATKMASVSFEDKMAGEEGLLIYAGSSENSVYFSSRFKNKIQDGYRITEFSNKAKVMGNLTFPKPKVALLPMSVKSYGLTGAHYLNIVSNNNNTGSLMFKNGKKYFTGIIKETLTPTVWSYNKDNLPYKIGEATPIKLEKKSKVKAGALITENGIWVDLVVDDNNQLIIAEDENVSAKLGKVKNSKNLIYNPSSLKATEKQNGFIHLVGNEIYTFDKGQLKKVGPVYFEKL